MKHRRLKKSVKKNIKRVIVTAAAALMIFNIPLVNADDTPDSEAVQNTVLTQQDEEGRFTVSVSADKGVIPDGSELKVTALKEEDEQYQSAKDSYINSKKEEDASFDESTLGLEALDISIMNNGVEEEPDGKVNVSIQMNSLPDGVDSDTQLEVSHIVKEKPLAIMSLLKKASSSNTDNNNNQYKAEKCADMSMDNGTGSADFEVDSFSVFTITWTKSADDATRIANVNVHYVDENGNELDTPTTQPTSDMLSKSLDGIVNLSSYAVGDNAASRMANYTYKEARMSDPVSGTVITGLMATSSASGNTTSYSLKYTTNNPVPTLAIDTSWTNVPVDAVTNANNNSVDVYLVYQQNDHIIVHYVDGAGNELQPAEAKYLSEITGEAGISVAKDNAESTWATEITNYTFDSAHLNSYLGDTVVAVKGVQNENGYNFQIKNTATEEFKDVAATDLYLVYNKTNGIKVEVYYTDIAGIPITDAAGNPIKKTYDPAEWTSGTHDFTTDATSYTPDGYAAFDKSNINAADDIPNWWGGGKPNHDDNNNKQNRILYVTDGVVNSSSNRFGAEILRSVRGYEFDTMSYVNGKLSISRSSSYGGGGKGATAIPDDDKNNSPYKVYLLFKPLVKIHDVDANGNSLGNDRTDSWSVGYYSKNRWSGNNLDSSLSSWNNTINSYSVSDLTANQSLGTRTSLYVKYVDANSTEKKVEVSNCEDGSNNFKISWQFDGPQKWSIGNESSAILNDSAEIQANYHWVTRIYKNADCSEYQDINGLITDVYMVYDTVSPLNVTIHHVDTNGNKIADDTTKIISTGNTYTIYKDLLSKEQSNDFQYAPVNGYTDADKTNAFTSITYTQSGNTWNDNLSASDAAHKELWVVYTPTKVVIHHVDEEGKRIAADTNSFTITNNKNVYTNKWNGSSNVIDNNHNARATGWIGGHADSYNSATTYPKGGIWYKYDSDTGVWHTAIGIVASGDQQSGGGYSKVTSTALSATANDSGEIDTNNPKFISDFYQVYSGVKGITVHHVDEFGNKLADDTYSSITTEGTDNTVLASSLAASSLTASGYSVGAAYVDAERTKKFDKITYKGNDWSFSLSDGSNTDTDGFNQEVYLVYGKNLTLHYIHPVYDADGTIKTDSDGNLTYDLFGSGATYNNNFFPITITYSQVEAAGDNGLQLTNGVGDDNASSDYPYAQNISEENNTYNYYGSYLASPNSNDNTKALPSYARLTTDGPNVKRVRIHDGKYQFLVRSGDGSNRPLTLTTRNQWRYVTEGGRTYTLRKNGDNFVMLDSQVGRNSYDLSLTSTDTNTTDKQTVNYYTATSGSEGTGIVYTIREIIPNDAIAPTAYDVTVHEWTDVAQHDIWQVYTKETDTPVVTISNEVVYSGNLVARTVNLGENQIVSYTWQKQINGGTWTDVVRTQNGSEWNIAHDLKDRSWLDLAADEGELSEEEGRSSVKYRVTLTYANKGVENQKSVTSQEFSVPYWDQLENGSFENPDNTTLKNVNTYSQNKLYYDQTFYSNEYYKQLGGVWQTTGLGSSNSGGGSAGKDIEIVNTKKDNKYLGTYGFKQGGTTGTADGKSQFAELNAEAAGALYQDVVTHPNEYLNYWLSHRARGEDTRDTQTTTLYYDTMYLVIMPTKLAMTSASDGGELKSQDDLEKFIANHGGYEESGKGNNHTSEENSVIYRDTNSGVLVVRITSDNNDWHNISVSNGYIATSSLTRFFFVAGPTAYHGNDDATRNKTIGNLIDAVGFSQKLQTPDTPHYHMVVKKTFSGLTTDEVAKLASNRQDGSKFQIKIDEYIKNDNGEIIRDESGDKASYYFEKDTNSEDKHNTLNGAILSFNVDNSNNFTLTATGYDPNDSNKRVDLLTNGSTGVVSEDPETGDIIMTWTLYNNYFGRGIDEDVGEKYFKLTESGTDIDGYSTTTVNDGTIEDVTSEIEDGVTTSKTTISNLYSDVNGNGISQSGNTTGLITVKDRSTARINYSNSYRNNSDSEPALLRVQKTFTGITPSVVDNLISSADPYKVTVTNSDNSSITLVGNSSNPVSGIYPIGVDQVTVSQKNNNDGSSTLTWTIYGSKDSSWVKENDSYTVKEERFVPNANNKISSVTINDVSDGVTVNNRDKATATAEKSGIAVGNNSGVSLNIGDKLFQTVASSVTLEEGTNLIIAQYNSGWLVWTHDQLGVNARAAIIKTINSLNEIDQNSSIAASTSNVSFRSGANPGKITFADSSRSLTYNSETRELSFQNGSSDSWAKYLTASNAKLQRNNKDIADDDAEVRIVNSYEPAIRILKKSSGEDSKPLSGAEFKLYKYDGDTKRYFTKNKDFGEGEDEVFITGEDGIASSTDLKIINNLAEGTYYLEETKAPAGYNKPRENIVAITVDSKGIVKLVTDTAGLKDISKINTNTTGDEAVTIDWNSPYYTITITNRAGSLLPLTGGSGKAITIMFAGVLLVLIGILLIEQQKLKSMNMDDKK